MIVALHGFTGTPGAWAAVTDGVAEPLLGHAPHLVHPGTFAGEVDRVAARIAPLAPVHLVGYSMGARLALALLARAPELVARATVIGVHPGLGEDERAARVVDDETWARLLEAEGIAAFVTAWERRPLFATQARLPADRRAAHRRRRLEHSAAGLAHSLRALGLGAMPALWPALAALPVPVTYVVGALDPTFCALAARAHATTPRAALRIVPGAGHDVALEDPRAVAAILEEDPP